MLDDPDRVDYHLCEKTKEIAPAISAFSEKLRASKEEDDSPTKSPKRWRRSASRQAALDAASRGLKVACIERGDFANETSSRSSKLIWGGFKYLQVGQPWLGLGPGLGLGLGLGCLAEAHEP